MKKKRRQGRTHGAMVPHRLFADSFYENLSTLIDEQIADLMKEPGFREMVEDFNARMFEMMAQIARRSMNGRKPRARAR